MSTVLVIDGIKHSGGQFQMPVLEGNLLYHYCSFDTFQKIVDSKKIRASDLRYVNDLSELKHFGSTVSVLAQQRIQSHGASEVLRQLIAWVSERSRHGPSVFAASFSKNGNLLSQWRGYCPLGSGVSIGFARADLSAVAASQDFSVKDCQYTGANQDTCANQAAELFLERVLSSESNPVQIGNWHESQKYWGTFLAMEDDFLQEASTHKSGTFVEEAEVRLISKVYHNYAQAPISFRATEGTMVPYLDFELPLDENQALKIKNVFVGPNATPSETIHALNMFLAKQRVSPIQIQYCGIPLRT
jgi:hypothetical protein